MPSEAHDDFPWLTSASGDFTIRCKHEVWSQASWCYAFSRGGILAFVLYENCTTVATLWFAWNAKCFETIATRPNCKCYGTKKTRTIRKTCFSELPFHFRSFISKVCRLHKYCIRTFCLRLADIILSGSVKVVKTRISCETFPFSFDPLSFPLFDETFSISRRQEWRCKNRQWTGKKARHDKWLRACPIIILAERHFRDANRFQRYR